MINRCMYYTIYKTTNKINGKFYIGKHQTDNPNDGYYGSGKKLEAAIKKYGRENFIKEVLFIYDNEHDMNNKEKEIITEDFVKDKNTYNVGIGGEGGPHFKGKKHTEEAKAKFNQKGKSYKKSKETLEKEKQSRLEKNNGTFFSQETIEKIRQKALERNKDKTTKNKISEKMKEFYKNNPVSDERKQKMSESRKGQKMSEEQKEKIRQTMKNYWAHRTN